MLVSSQSAWKIIHSSAPRKAAAFATHWDSALAIGQIQCFSTHDFELKGAVLVGTTTRRGISPSCSIRPAQNCLVKFETLPEVMDQTNSS